MRAARASTGSWVLFMHQRGEERIDIARRFSRKLDFLFTDELRERVRYRGLVFCTSSLSFSVFTPIGLLEVFLSGHWDDDEEDGNVVV